jgi:predicted RNase H-like HicB family nuclease
LQQYIGLIHKDPGSDYGISFPDFPGCVSAGKTVDETRAMGQEALAFHIEGMIEDGEAVPEPSTLEQIMSDPENRGGLAVLVPVETAAAKIVRVNITLPEDTLAAIDRFAEARGFTRSGFLAAAARKAMNDAA